MGQALRYIGPAAVVISSPAFASSGGEVRSISLPAQSLAASLQAIAQRYGVELLFSQALVGNRFAPPISGRMSAQQALESVLAGSTLIVRRTPEGSFIVAATPIAVSQQPDAEPDILVIGRRTQNTDIRRTENDVRPYQVIGRESIMASHVATVEELAAKRLPANAQGVTASQQGASARGRTGSSVDLRGLGSNETLVLVDGRRLPMMPTERSGFLQSDVNAIPPEALERVEAITATAGGIYGPGATAGVINLVLRRDYRGIDLAVTSGVSSRGDGPYRRADLRVGFTPDHGATDVMVDVARSNFAGLSVGDRDFTYRATARSFANLPSYFVTGGPPASASITVIARDGSPLMFKPAFGSGALGSAITFAAPADSRSTASLIQTLTENAGKFDATPSADSSTSSLLSGRQTTSIIASARHRSGPIELFADVLSFANVGHARLASPSSTTTLQADNPANPFVQAINVYAPSPNAIADFRSSTKSFRATGGLIANLPGSWRGEADYSLGSATQYYLTKSRQVTSAGNLAYYAGNRDPLGNYSQYLNSLDGLFGDSRSTSKQRNRFTDVSLRLAGPVVSLDGGKLSATLLGERRSERVSGGVIDTVAAGQNADVVSNLPAYAQVTQSFYGEIRAPLVDARTGYRLLRGLELQIAVRNDQVDTEAVRDIFSTDGGGTRRVRNSGTVYTAGFKASPIEGFLVRGSISSGQRPLSVGDLARYALPGLTFNDPKRPGTYAFYDDVSGGPPNPKPEHAQSLSVGVVFEPARRSDLRLSLDYTHIRKRGEDVISLANNDAYFIANENLYPGRVTRSPLTPEDAALGYTGGVITQVDSSSLQNGETIVDALDATLNLRIPTARVGVVDLRGAAAWQLRFRRIIGFGLPDRDYVGSSDGVPALRANIGARWTLKALSLSIDGQLTGRHRTTSAIEFLREIQQSYQVVEQGSSVIPAQATFDLAAEYRMSLPGGGLVGRPKTLTFRVGVEDILDSKAATEIGAYGSYNNWLDPRRRRFELGVAAGF